MQQKSIGRTIIKIVLLNVVFVFAIATAHAQQGRQQSASPCTLKANVQVQSTLCIGANQGTARVSAQGGTAPYTYTWGNSKGQGTLATSLRAGKHVVTVTDATGCQVIVPFEILAQKKPQISAKVQAPSGVNAANGTVTLNLNALQAPYQIFYTRYEGFQNTGRQKAVGSTLTNMPAGRYVIDVVDANGCIASVSVNLVPNN